MLYNQYIWSCVALPMATRERLALAPQPFLSSTTRHVIGWVHSRPKPVCPTSASRQPPAYRVAGSGSSPPRAGLGITVTGGRARRPPMGMAAATSILAAKDCVRGGWQARCCGQSARPCGNWAPRWWAAARREAWRRYGRCAVLIKRRLRFPQAILICLLCSGSGYVGSWADGHGQCSPTRW